MRDLDVFPVKRLDKSQGILLRFATLEKVKESLEKHHHYFQSAVDSPLCLVQNKPQFSQYCNDPLTESKN